MIPVPVPSTPATITDAITARAEELLSGLIQIFKNGTSGGTPSLQTVATMVPPNPNPNPASPLVPLILDTPEKQLFFRQLFVALSLAVPSWPSTTRFGVVPAGVKDGVNTTFTTTEKFISTAIAVYLTGVRQVGTYTVQEGGGAGTGFNTIVFASAPAPSDTIVVDYVAA